MVSGARDTQPDIIALSALVTAGYESIRDTIALLREQERMGWKLPPVVIGGGMIDDRVCHYVGADCYATDALTGVRLCEELVAGKKTAHHSS